MLQNLNGYKTYIAGAGAFLVFGWFVFSQDYQTAAGWFVTGAGLIGIGHKLDKVLAEARKVIDAIDAERSRRQGS